MTKLRLNILQPLTSLLFCDPWQWWQKAPNAQLLTRPPHTHSLLGRTHSTHKNKIGSSQTVLFMRRPSLTTDIFLLQYTKSKYLYMEREVNEKGLKYSTGPQKTSNPWIPFINKQKNNTQSTALSCSFEFVSDYIPTIPQKPRIRRPKLNILHST